MNEAVDVAEAGDQRRGAGRAGEGDHRRLLNPIDPRLPQELRIERIFCAVDRCAGGVSQCAAVERIEGEAGNPVAERRLRLAEFQEWSCGHVAAAALTQGGPASPSI